MKSRLTGLKQEITGKALVAQRANDKEPIIPYLHEEAPLLRVCVERVSCRTPHCD